MRSTKTTKEKLIERINTLKELPRTDNVQSMLNRLEQELSDLGRSFFRKRMLFFLIWKEHFSILCTSLLRLL